MLWYLATPYSHANKEIEQHRFEQACLIAAKLMDNGILVFSPIAHTHSIAMMGKLPTGFEYWRKYDTTMITPCIGILVVQMQGWQDSKGIGAELVIARSMNKVILYLHPETMVVSFTP